MRNVRLFSIFILCALLAGCAFKNNPSLDVTNTVAARRSPELSSEEGKQFIEHSYAAAETLAHVLDANDIPGNQTITLVSFVNVDDMERTSTLGRLIPEQISSRLSQLGYRTAELKERGNIISIRNGDGEFSLSRNLPNVLKNEGFTSVLAGTYALEPDAVYVNARIIDVRNQNVLAGADFALRATPGIRAMSERPVNIGTPLVPSVDTSFSKHPSATATYTVRSIR